MTNKKTTKRLLVSSVISMLLCCVMFIGTTFAWFTDSVTSGKNSIQAGNLEIDLLMDKEVNGTYTSIANENGDIFNTANKAQNASATLWEPNKTQVAYLKIENKGSLDVKYKVTLNVTNGETSIKPLTDVMKYAITSDATAENKVTAWDEKVATSVVEGKQEVTTDVFLAAKTSHCFALSVHMDAEAGNDYQKGTIYFDLAVDATQAESESDSFGSDYDAGAEYPVSKAPDLVTLPSDGDSFEIGGAGTYALRGTVKSEQYVIKIPAGVDATIDGSALKFEENSSILIVAGGKADGMSTIAQNGEWKDRAGNYTIKNFNVPSGAISVTGLNTTLTIEGNTAKAMDVDGSNCTINVIGNTVDCEGSYPRSDGSTNDKSFYLLAVNYDLKLEGNTFTNSEKDTISINGRGEWDMADAVNSGTPYDGSIAINKVQNSIVLNDNTLDAQRRALYIWGDHTYGSNHTLSGNSTVEQLSDEARILVKELLEMNEIVNEECVYAGFGGLYLTKEACEEAIQ